MVRKTALLIIDAQLGLIEGSQPVYQKDQLLRVLQKILYEARELQLPIVFVQDLDVAELETAEFQIHPAIAPETGELVIHKKATDAFHQTDLHQELQRMGINHLAVAGCKTEFCVDTACRKATSLGYDVTLVKDGHSTTSSAVLDAEQIIAHHNHHLHGFNNIDGAILVRESSETIFSPTHDSYR